MVINKPISIAMLTSMIIHLALALLASLILAMYVDPSIVNRVLVLNLKLLQADQAVTATQQTDNHLTTIKPASKPRIAENQAVSKSASVEVPAKYKQPAAAEPSVSSSAEARPQLVSPSPAANESPAVDVAAITEAQTRMLTRKFRKWTENYYTMADTKNSVTWRHGGHEYLARFRRQPAKDNMGKEHVIVNVSTEENGHKLSTEMRMTRLTFSDFAQFVNHWDPHIRLHKDEMDGRFHSNSKISVEYTREARPRFHGKVTTTSGGIDVVNARGRVKREKIFLGGLETRVKRIALPKHAAPFSDHSAIRDEQVKYFEQDTRITFYSDGTYGWKSADSTATEQKVSIAADAAYIIGARKKKLFIKGVVSGKVLVYSPERIVIENDLTYAHDPETTRNANDYLGLVSDKNIDIASPATTGRGDLLVYASIYAKRRFAIRNYWQKGNAMLLIYGSVTAGSLSATEPRYHTKIQFDKRLENSRPPGFPMTNRYEVEYRDDNWSVGPSAVSQSFDSKTP